MKSMILGFFLLLAWSSGVQAQTAFYQGKSIKHVVGSPAGSNYDMYGRLTAAYLGKYLPGNPEVIVQNMVGAGSMVAANYLYRVAAPDGLTIGSILPGLYFDQLVGRTEVQFDYAKFSWIGSTDRSNNLVVMRADSPTRACATCVELRSLLSVRPREPARSLIKFPGSWRKLSARNSILSPAIREGLTWTWQWREARSSAARLPLAPISAAANLILAGAKKVLFGC